MILTFLIVSILINFLLIFFIAKYSLVILNMEESIEKSLDILDKSYFSITKILQTPLFYDSQEVRQVLNELKNSRDSILIVANIISANIIQVDPDNNEEINDAKQ
jgi:hypothetical protein